jgi:hypothetical protein
MIIKVEMRKTKYGPNNSELLDLELVSFYCIGAMDPVKYQIIRTRNILRKVMCTVR